MQEFRLPGPLLLLPPVGTPADLVDPQRRAFGDQLIVPDWVPYQQHESIERYAQRLAQSIRIDPVNDAPLFIAGISSGGAVALELAKRLTPQPRAVFLIGSMRAEVDLPLRVQIVEKLQSVMPKAMLAKLMPMGALLFALIEGLDDPNTKRLRQAARDTDLSLITWAGPALFDWESDGDFGADFPPVFQIHGRKDWVLPLHRDHADTVIPDGRHLIHLTHPITVNRYITRHCRAVAETIHAHPPAGRPDFAVAD